MDGERLRRLCDRLLGSRAGAPDEAAAQGAGPYPDLSNDAMSPLFQAAAEATEEAVYNAMLQAVTTTGIDGHCLHAIPAEDVLSILRHHRLGRPLP